MQCDLAFQNFTKIDFNENLNCLRVRKRQQKHRTDVSCGFRVCCYFHSYSEDSSLSSLVFLSAQKLNFLNYKSILNPKDTGLTVMAMSHKTVRLFTLKQN